jgi:hypothetical protein
MTAKTRSYIVAAVGELFVREPLDAAEAEDGFCVSRPGLGDFGSSSQPHPLRFVLPRPFLSRGAAAWTFFHGNDELPIAD